MPICVECNKDKRKFAKGLCSACYSRLNYKPKPSDRGPLQERFWKKVIKKDGCWAWSGSRSPAGYGRIWLGHGAKAPGHAHRVSYELHNGPIPDGAVVMHTCDNPECCNPEHLTLGSHGDNSQDKVAKRRHYYGEAHRSAKLTEQQVLYIRAAKEKTNADICREFGISSSVVSNIRKGKTWRHLL